MREGAGRAVRRQRRCFRASWRHSSYTYIDDKSCGGFHRGTKNSGGRFPRNPFGLRLGPAGALPLVRTNSAVLGTVCRPFLVSLRLFFLSPPELSSKAVPVGARGCHLWNTPSGHERRAKLLPFMPAIPGSPGTHGPHRPRSGPERPPDRSSPPYRHWRSGPPAGSGLPPD